MLHRCSSKFHTQKHTKMPLSQCTILQSHLRDFLGDVVCTVFNLGSNNRLLGGRR